MKKTAYPLQTAYHQLPSTVYCDRQRAEMFLTFRIACFPQNSKTRESRLSAPALREGLAHSLPMSIPYHPITAP